MSRIFASSLGKLKIPLQVVTFPLVGIQTGFIFRSSNNELKAFANVCVHRGLELDWDDDRDFFDETGALRCKAHDARFDDTGNCIKGPRSCIGKRLWRLQIHVEDENVFVSNIPSEMLDFRKDFSKSTLQMDGNA